MRDRSDLLLRAGLSEERRETGGGLFGRQKGKKLRDEQQRLIETLLPVLQIPLDPAGSPLDPAALFAGHPARFALEIGFGGAEHLLFCARTSPDTGFIGVEPFLNGMAKAVSGIDKLGLDNIRLHQGDAIDVLRALPDASLSTIFILYPDPWPKRRQRKRRFISRPSLAAMARVLQPGGSLLFASDIDDYLGWTLGLIDADGSFSWNAQTAADWTTPYEDWPGTRYEAKAKREGRIPSYFTFTRK